MEKTPKTGRPRSRNIDDSARPAAERGLPLGETRHSFVCNKDQLKRLDELVEDLIKMPGLRKTGVVPSALVRALIYEALNNLLRNYKNKKSALGKKEEKVKRGNNKMNEAKLGWYLEQLKNKKKHPK